MKRQNFVYFTCPLSAMKFHGQNPQDCGFLPWKNIYACVGKAICLEESTAVVRDEEKVLICVERLQCEFEHGKFHVWLFCVLT